MSLESVLHVKDLMPTSRAKDRPARMALYSAWLLDVLKAKWGGFLNEDIVGAFQHDACTCTFRIQRTIYVKCPLVLCGCLLEIVDEV